MILFTYSRKSSFHLVTTFLNLDLNR